jgi:2,3-bisphosphoglycerate-dependent phosphoglycerate mutase
MSVLVLVRHGESRWNVTNRFTGWIDVPLSLAGVREAEECAKHCTQYDFDAAFTSKLERARSTLTIILTRQNRTGVIQHENESTRYRWICDGDRCLPDDIPIFDSESLNERYYGVLQGMNKKEVERKYGKEQVLEWRRGYLARPPKGESLKEAHDRMHPYLIRKILPRVRKGQNILVTAHGNTLRAAIKHLENISDADIAFVDLPEAKPIVYEWKNGKFRHVKGEYSFNRPLR